MENFKEIKYSSPKEAVDIGEDPQHRFDLMLNGEQVGAAEVDYYSKPLPLYQITGLYVDFEHRGQGFASSIMDQVEAFLNEREKPGVLVDAILGHKAAAGMYDRRGWQKTNLFAGPSHVYNWPSDIPINILENYALRYPSHLDRQKRKTEQPPIF